MDARDGALCRACSRQTYRFQKKEPCVSMMKQMALARAKRKAMLEFLEKEADGGGTPDGVFDLNVSYYSSIIISTVIFVRTRVSSLRRR